MCLRLSGYMVYWKWSSNICSGKYLEYVKMNHGGISLVVQWLRLCLPMQRGVCSSPVEDLRSHISLGQKSQNIKQKQYYNKFNKYFKKISTSKKKIYKNNSNFKQSLISFITLWKGGSFIWRLGLHYLRWMKRNSKREWKIIQWIVSSLGLPWIIL